MVFGMAKYLLFIFLFESTLVASDKKFSFAPDNIERFSHTQFTWWAFNIYKAEIWTPESKKPDFADHLILHIRYQKDIKAAKLVSTTKDEWVRLKLINPESAEWLKKLTKIWPDIKSGDSLTTYSDTQKTFFYQGVKLLGSIDDKAFGPMFLKIWLHKNSQTSELLKKK